MKKKQIIFITLLFIIISISGCKAIGKLVIVPPNGPLVGYYKLDGNTSDSSGNNNNGMFFPEEGEEYTNMISGGALNFNGEGYIYIYDTAHINIRDVYERSYSLWIKAQDTTTRQIIYKEGDSEHGISIYFDKDKLYVGFWSESSLSVPGKWLSTPYDDVIDWHHIAVSLDFINGVQKLYLDNIEKASSDITGFIPPHEGNIKVGKGYEENMDMHDGPDSSNMYLKGTIDEVRIYNKVISSEEVIDLYSEFDDYYN